MEYNDYNNQDNQTVTEAPVFDEQGRTVSNDEPSVWYS